MIVLFYVLIFRAVTQSLENDSTSFIENIASTLAKYCPNQDLAKINGNIERVSDGSCCTEFFYSNDTSSLLQKSLYDKKTFQTCLFLRSPPSSTAFGARSYYVVVDVPDGGCVQPSILHRKDADDQHIYEPRCDDHVVPWRRLFPVYSKKSGLIYKNPNCAFCHGEYDLIYWTPVHICSRFSYSPSDIAECEILYFYPDNHEDIGHLECFLNNFTTCGQDDFHVESGINLSNDEIMQACKLDTLPTFTNFVFAKNIFCYMCNSNININPLPLQKCIQTEETDQVLRSTTVAFSSVIDTETVMKDVTNKNARETRRVCANFGMSKECQQLLCPLGQIWKKGSCVVTSLQWGGVAQFKVVLVLSGDMNISVNGKDLKAMITEDKLRSPWSSRWKFHSLSRLVSRMSIETLVTIQGVPGGLSMDGMKKTTTNQLWAELYYKSYSFNPRLFLNDLARTMKKAWYLFLPQKTVTFKQAFSKFMLHYISFVDFTGINKMVGPICYKCFINHDRIPQLETLPIFEYVNFGFLLNRYTNVLQSLFFCQQVELPASYFMQFGNVLFNNVTGLLYDNEFYKIIDSQGQTKFRVCVSKFNIPDTNDTPVCYPMHCVMFFLSASSLILT